MVTAICRVTILLVVALGLTGALAAAGIVAAVPARADDGAHAVAERHLVERLNAERRERGLSTLAIDTELTRLARRWARDMAADATLSHNRALASQVRADYQRLAENVGRSRQPGAGAIELADQVHRGLMSSRAHRDSILTEGANRVGVGVAIADDGTMFVDQVFAVAPGSQDPEPIKEAVRVSRRLFDGDAAHVVLARSDVFADALGGTGLAGDDGPVLYTPGPRPHDPDPVLHPRTRAEIDRALGGSGRVYLLGGTHAVSPAVQRELAEAGYDVRRLAGPSRVETAVAVAEEIARLHGPPEEVVVARADAWPDAVTGGAYAAATDSPVLVTPRGDLHPAVAGFLERHDPATRWALGGTAALADATVAAAGADRVAGAERTATAVALARKVWGRTTASAGDRYSCALAHGDGAWAPALALAPWSAVHDAPQLLVGDRVPAPVRGYLGELGYGHGVAGEAFAAQSVPQAAVDELTARLSG